MNRRRRQFLISVGTIGIAGCAGDSNENLRSDTPRTDDESLTRTSSSTNNPETPTVIPRIKLTENPTPQSPNSRTPVVTPPDTAPPEQQASKIAASDGENGDEFGASVAISGDGTTAIIGVPEDEIPHEAPGTAYAVTRSDGSWNKVNKLVPDGDATLFGESVAVSYDGETALIGAANSWGPGGTTGLAYVFERSAESWSQQIKLNAADGDAGDYFGESVAVSDDGRTAVVGAIGDQGINGESSGSAYVFDGSGGFWNQKAKLVPEDGDRDDTFGRAVAVSSDGTTALIGADGDEDPNGEASSYRGSGGSAYVFEESDESWGQMAKLAAGDGDKTDSFGSAVSLSGDGTTALVGTNSGNSAYIFDGIDDAWNQTTKIAVDRGNLAGFGVAVALSNDGKRALIGATGTGSVYLFSGSTGSWKDVATLVPNDDSSDNFGSAVAISSDGATALIGDSNGGSPNGDSTGAAYIFQ